MDNQDNPLPRVERLERAIQDQRAFLHRIPDPDTRERGEMHLFELIEMREKLVGGQEQV